MLSGKSNGVNPSSHFFREVHSRRGRKRLSESEAVPQDFVNHAGSSLPARDRMIRVPTGGGYRIIRKRIGD